MSLLATHTQSCMQGLDFSHGISAVVPGWDDVRLLAPHAEMRLLCSGQSCLIDAHRLRCRAGDMARLCKAL